ncbi:hypothetical protein ACG3SL_12700 [Sphingomonas sp. CJ20]
MRTGLVFLALAGALTWASAANAQLADPPRYDPELSGPPTPAPMARLRTQELDLGTQSTQSSLEVVTATQMLRTMVAPPKPQIVRCDPRTLPDAQASTREGLAQPRPDELVLGRPGMAVVANDIYFMGTSDGTQCPQIGEAIRLPPFFNEVQR